jgi:hypothetical protein
MWPTKDQRAAHKTRLAEKKAEKEKWASSPTDNEMTAEEQWQHMWELHFKTPMTPRTRAFDELEGGYGAQPQRQSMKPHPSWVARAHGPQGGNAWYGGGDAGHVTVQQVSPVQEVDEYHYGYEGKGKGTVGFAH